MSTQQNQNKIWLPLNHITEKIYYTTTDKGQKRNQRLIVSALVENPNVWQVSKVENINPIGLQKLTIYQDEFIKDVDYVNLETGEMYANYYSSTIEPEIKESGNDVIINNNYYDIVCKLYCSTNNIKIGGSYKLVTASFFNGENDVTNDFTDISWKFYIDEELIEGNSFITLKEQDNINEIKIKLSNDRTYLTKKLTIVCESNGITGKTELEIISL